MSAAPAVYEIEVGGVGAGAAAPALNDSMGSIAHGIGRVQRRLPHRGSTLGRRRRRHPPGRSWPCGGFFNSLHVARPAHFTNVRRVEGIAIEIISDRRIEPSDVTLSLCNGRMYAMT